MTTITSSDCPIDLSSANGFDDSFIILDGDMSCSPSNQAAISISASRVTLDCKGHTINGTNVSEPFTKRQGILLNGDNLILQNCQVTGFGTGLLLDSSSNVVLNNITSTHNVVDGLKFKSQSTFSDITVLDSKFNDNWFGNGFEASFAASISNLFVSNVQGNDNGFMGFELENISNGLFVGIEALRNGEFGVELP